MTEYYKTFFSIIHIFGFYFVALNNFTLTFDLQINGFKALFHMKKYYITFFLLLGFLTNCEDSSDQNEEPIAPTTFLKYRNGKFSFNQYEPLADKPINIYTYLPVEGATDLPLIFVMHGNSRNVVNNCGYWGESARKYKFIVVCPEFNEADFPGSANYQNGMMLTGDQFADSTKWTYNLIEEIFSYLKQNNVTTYDEFGIYGYSAGGQFVHRYALFTEPRRASLIIAGGSGWYTLPNYSEDFPYGLNNSPFNKENLSKKLQLPLIVMVGENDTNPNDSDLRKTVQAMRQGEHRYARAKYFYRSAAIKAADLGVNFNWTFTSIPDVGHSSESIAPHAAEIFFKSLND
tara:strand:+ start:98 stop:1135 length:1038 start_codon:yes stop_codon:yes gene_type:complete